MDKKKDNKEIVVDSISSYLDAITKEIEVHRMDNSFFVYRGESQLYPETSGVPNVFRNDKLEANSQYENNLYLLLSQNDAEESCHLLKNAINAQHDEFNSRLLDVSYNCLVALYFAVTPYYHRPEDSLDTKDGVVFIYEINEIYSPVAENTKDTFEATLKSNNNEWFHNGFFARKHKFIDHSKQNSRIIAQQGAFLLFQGAGYCQINDYMKRIIKISGSSKSTIRRQLKELFGIYTGSIYPEITNTVSYFSEKSMLVNSDEFGIKGEILSVLGELDSELDYIVSLDNEKMGAENKILKIESLFNEYRIELLEIFKNLDSDEDKKEIKNSYNNILIKYKEFLASYIIENDSFEYKLDHYILDIE